MSKLRLSSGYLNDTNALYTDKKKKSSVNTAFLIMYLVFVGFQALS